MLWVGLFACVYDADDRCGPNQALDEFNRCRCVAGTVEAEKGCAPCSEHELEQNGTCVCDTGYSRAAEGAPCTLPEPDLGKSCDASSPCGSGYLCQPTSGDSGYCTTSDCSDESPCTDGYACDVSASPPYCKRPPIGQGASCMGQADCASYEATYCETMQGKVCLVQDCTVGGDDCFIGWSCCDLSGFGLARLCVPEGECPVP